MNVGVIVLPRTSRCTPWNAGLAYSCEAAPKAGSAQSSNGDVTEIFWCRIAVSVPSRRAPSSMCCSCSSRCPQEVNIWPRGSASRTGRRTCWAASAVSVTCGHTMALQPNAPPTYRVSTRILDGDMPSSAATVSCTALMPWQESYRVSWSPSQTAVVVSASIGL